MLRFTLVMLTLFSATSFAIAAKACEQDRCSESNAKAAESVASSLNSWPEVHRAFSKMAACDGGAIGEGFSESVVSLLVAHWSKLDELARLTRHDSRFERFVIRHVDELMSPDEAKQIFQNANNLCPPHASRLCAALRRRVEELKPAFLLPQESNKASNKGARVN